MAILFSQNLYYLDFRNIFASSIFSCFFLFCYFWTSSLLIYGSVLPNIFIWYLISIHSLFFCSLLYDLPLFRAPRRYAQVQIAADYFFKTIALSPITACHKIVRSSHVELWERHSPSSHFEYRFLSLFLLGNCSELFGQRFLKCSLTSSLRIWILHRNFVESFFYILNFFQAYLCFANISLLRHNPVFLPVKKLVALTSNSSIEMFTKVCSFLKLS